MRTLEPGFEEHRQECLCHTGMAVLSMARLPGRAEEEPISPARGSCATGVAQTLLSVLSVFAGSCSVTTMPVAVEVHHAVVQGLDGSRFYEALQSRLRKDGCQ